MENLDLNERNVFKQVPASDKNLFDDMNQDFQNLALTLIEFNKAVHTMGDHLKQSLLTYSELSTKNQRKG